MDSDYDRKFEDMKKYIPFLESMIKRLESTSTSSANPRQAQLDKIRSLRDLLLDKKKRMKMENLLKCEQVLVNLYAKVEQRDTLPGINKASDTLFSSASSKQDLNLSRSKTNPAEVKTTVVVDDPDTLPEIARACETEVICTPGSKEPALFQRRPNKKSISPSRPSQSIHTEKKSPQKSVPKRNYTRVLVSPEPSSDRWPSTERTTDKPLFTRRSPITPSPSYSKKEKKKSSKQNKPLPKDLNITLNVPEESLNSLNTGDILSRIIKCPDNDVDIDTLRDLRQQILGELKQTGASEDISDLILKSYKQKKKKPSRKKDEVEEGELSDSESEAIASVYGSLVVVDKNESNTGQTKIPEKEKQPRKIQICLVINSDKETASTDQTNEPPRITDASDFEMFDDIQPAKSEEITKTNEREQKVTTKLMKSKEDNSEKVTEKIGPLSKIQDVITIDDDDVSKDTRKAIELECKSSDSSLIDISSPEGVGSPEPTDKRDSETAAPFRANFYKPLSEPEHITKNTTQLKTGNDNSEENTNNADTISKEVTPEKTVEQENGNPSGEKSSSNKSDSTHDQILNSEKTDLNIKESNVNTDIKETDDVANNTEEIVEIPLLNLEPTVPAPPKKDNVSEIEILQALKNEILSESISIPGAEVTPALHQPKVTKVASAKEVIKKRISIEKYKQKSAPTTKPSLFINDPSYSRYSDQSKKHSLKLTEEELERFNFPAKLALHDSSEEENEGKDEATYSLEDIYADLAPKSPETTEEPSTEKTTPIIIPVDPVKPVIVSSKTDVDMRTITPTISPSAHHQPVHHTVLPSSEVKIVSEPETKVEPKRSLLVDPRMRRELNKSTNKESPNPHAIIQERTPRPMGTFPNMTPNLAPNMTPNSRSFEMTPSRQSIEADDNNSRKHVYAPFPTVDSRWESNSDYTKESRNNRWEPWMDVDTSDGSHSRKWEDRDRRSGSVRDNDYQKSRYDTEANSSRYSQDQGDTYSRIDCPRTPVHPFGRSDCPPTPTPSFGMLDGPINPFIRADCPPTPGHPFGMSDYPMTPSHPFGRTDVPMTPSHPFGRSDMPMTPSHPFGRIDVTMTPSHPFGRTDAPMTPSHPFGRTDAPMTPSHPFGRSDAPITPSHQFGRSDSGMAPMTPNHPFGRSDYTHNQHIPGPRKDPRLNRSSDYGSSKRKHDNRDRGYKDQRKSDNRSYNNDSYYGREQSVGRNDRHLVDRRNNRDSMRGQSRGRSVTRDYEPENIYPGDHSGNRLNDFYHDVETSKYSEAETRRGYQRAQSVGRSRPEERFCRSSSRAPSFERNYEKEVNNDNTLSVKPQSGRSFTIDTSVNTTFQEFLKDKGLQEFDRSFDSRRQRAASVGRSLTREPGVGKNFRESSVGRTMAKPPHLINEDTSGYKTMVHFVRARSMGRDLADKPEKSFKDIKAEFESYRTNNKPKQINPNIRSKGAPSSHSNRKKDFYGEHGKITASTSHIKKPAYSPRKNYRDPRMRNDNYDSKNKNRHQDKKNFGIVYTHDNITKGTILGSGYGVKNYKIPKIKRPVEEPVVKEAQKNSKINEKKNTVVEKEKHVIIRKGTKKEQVTEIDCQAKLVTKKGKDKHFGKEEDKKQNIIESKPKQARKTKRSDKIEPETSAPIATTVRTRRAKKAVFDSDSDSEPTTKTKNEDIVKVDVPKTSNNNDEDIIRTPIKNNEEDILDTSFGMDEIFPENITSDPVMANINALIADLDNDIDTTKTEDLSNVFKDIAFNSLLESISTPSDNKQLALEQSLNDISEVIETHSQNIIPDGEKELAAQAEEQTNETNVNVPNQNPGSLVKEAKESKLNDISNSNNKPLTRESCDNGKNEKNVNDLVINQDIVSTTEIEKEPLNKLEEVNTDRCSTPDSTINTNEVVHNQSHDEVGLPDSTNEKNDMQTDVTSTHDQSESSEKNTSLETEPISIGNLLSILKDKSTTKKLLSMLGDQSEENQKIKKKLEMLLSESDEEDTNDGMRDDLNEKGEEIENDENNTSEEKVKENIPEDESPNISVDETQAVKESEDLSKAKESSKELNETETTTLDNTEEVTEEKQSPDLGKPRKVTPKKNRKGKNKPGKKVAISKERRVTRSGVAVSRMEKPKKASRELRQLQESIKEMFMSDDILNATGIRMCRLAKMADDKSVTRSEEDSASISEPKPVVVLEKFNEKQNIQDPPKTRKKPGPKVKPKISVSEIPAKSDSVSKEIKTSLISKHRPGPKSKTKIVQEESDPYSFDDSVSEATTGQTSVHTSSDSDDDSIASSKSFGSSEVLADIKKKPKRKRRPVWQSGVIKSSKRRKKSDTKQVDSSYDDASSLIPEKPVIIPDMNCFTDKTYCFLKNICTYYCRLCEYSGTEIVKHYKSDHPHSEIPLSRMDPTVAREAIDECENVHFQTISKMSTDKYVCRFCFEEFYNKRAVLEEFFWHVVSMHTGEYKRLCSECTNVYRCPFNLDIPPPPKDVKGQLIGYICGKCYFTQISLENLKIHVIVRHNDEQTAVYTINLAAIGKRTMKTLLKRCKEQPRVLRSLRSHPNADEETGNQSEHSNPVENDSSDTDSKATSSKEIDSLPIGSVQAKLEFESDDYINNKENNDSPTVKVERNDNAIENQEYLEHESDAIHQHASSDILDYPHFKISYKESGTKEYVCCINGTDNHYKTSLLISMKKHVQTKHSEIWDGYCFVCKVIVMPQGQHYLFKECLQHLLDKHMDNLPVLEEKEIDNSSEKTINPDDTTPDAKRSDSSKTYINVRPLSDLLSKEPTDENPVALPKIQSVISLGAVPGEASPPSPICTSQTETDHDETTMSFKTPSLPSKTASAPAPVPEEIVKYEEVQAEVLSKKHRVIIDAMMSHEKLIQIYKCAGRFCSFTTDSADAAVLHASSHQRIGGENSLNCAYCDFDCRGNAIDLVMHVFKVHGRCQYACGHCFYRACASQLVVFHITRIHGEAASQIVLEATTVTPVNEDSTSNVLPRETAVQHYICNSLDGTCKFKTYMPGKFIDHLSKHAATDYTCYICSEVLQNPNELLYHMKNHGMKLYQCTWCIDGGDNEADFMAHSSARHPAREPQAYLRITTTAQKDGASKTMILPLVKLNNSNKSNIPTTLVTPNANVEDPAKEAERAIDLEKIITSMPLLASEAKKPQIPTLAPTCELPPVSSPIEDTFEPEIILDPQTLSTPPRSEQIDEPTVSILTHVIKKEPLPETPTKDSSTSDVICLDSDEEDCIDSSDSRAKVIDLSEENSSPTANVSSQPKPELTKLLPLELFKCQKCNVTFKNHPGFKRHITSCFIGFDTYRCAHCPMTTKDVNDLCLHYNADHSHQVTQTKLAHICGVCQRTDKSKWVITYHLKKDHGATHLVTTAKFEDNKSVGYVYTIGNGPKQKQTSKRKQSLSSSSDTPPKRTRYSPQDLDKLPQKPILDDLTYCSECEFSTKVRLNLVRHFQQHAEAQTVPQTTPVNPVPHLETNERHFDKMVNLASSSLETIRSDKQPPAVTYHIPEEAALRFPKYVPDKLRYTCGAKGCSYISVDEGMFKCHWDTLHASSNYYHCVHCPPLQSVDTSRPLVAGRILTHLKMHDARLYACTSCTFYHFRKNILEKHLAEVHKGAGEVMVVREEFTNQSPVSLPQPSNAAPTMDLKPWKCGLCEFKSMLRPAVIEHCSKAHSTKMQFKCPVCPFRTSALENVTKHQSHSHPGNIEEVFYYYYREGSIPDEPDGTPRWMKQRQKMGNPEPEVKTETPDTSQQSTTSLAPILPTPARVDLDIVKKEVVDTECEESIEDLCKHFGEICDPNGLKYKCPLCKFVIEDSKDAMQSHLYEELQYRKWGCSICSYKAFHKTGLHDHVVTEHAQKRQIDPIELPPDTRVERWVSYVLDHQSAAIESNKTNLGRQKIQVDKPGLSSAPTPAKEIETPRATVLPPTKKPDHKDIDNIVQAFGPLGSPNSTNFCCPKCAFQTADDGVIKDHLETELNKIRWRCSGCCEHSQNYHEAQLHSKTCKSSLAGQAPRPVEAVRDPTVRAAWVAAVISTQKLTINQAPATVQTPRTSTDDAKQSKPDNSLLVVRYEEEVQIPEEEMLSTRKRPATTVSSPDSDDERLVIDEETLKKVRNCPYCEYSSKYQQALEFHMLRHWNLRPYTCCYCESTVSKNSITGHTAQVHPGMPERYKRTRVPTTPPTVLELAKRGKRFISHDDTKTKDEMVKDSRPRLVCLVCENVILEGESDKHKHDVPTYFARKGDVVVKCCICLSLVPNINCLKEHQLQNHPNVQINYAYFKLSVDTREILVCGHCSKYFKYMRDLQTHHDAHHAALQLKYESKVVVAYDAECDKEGGETSRNKTNECENLTVPTVRKVAKKSTTKLPSQTVARKSTTKLPFYFYPELESEREFSFYGTKPTPLGELDNVTTLMPFCNTMMPFTMKKLSEIIKIDPVVLVKDCKK